MCLFGMLVAPLLLLGAFGAHGTNTNNVSDWLPKKFEATQRLEWFVERFGSDEILAVSWPGCDLDDERLDEFASRLLKPFPSSDGSKQVLFRQVLTGRSVRDQLATEPLNLPESAAMKRMSGWLVNGRNRQTCAIAFVKPGPDGRRDRKAAVAAAVEVADQLGIPHESLKMAGPTADAVAIDVAGSEGVLLLAMLAAVWGGLLGWLCLRHIRRSTIVFVAAIFAWSCSLSIVYYSGENMDAVLLTMPRLVFVLGISGAIHLTHYYQEALQTVPARQAATLAIRNGWQPCVLATVTTACGLGSLAISSVTPVVRFGVFSTCGVAAVLLCILTIWPAMTQMVSPLDDRSRSPSSSSRWWTPIHRLSVGNAMLLLMTFLACCPFLIRGVARTETSLQLGSLLPKSSHLIQSYAWFDREIGPVVPVAVVLDFPAAGNESDRDASKTMLQRAQLVESIRARIQDMPSSGGAMAATTFAPKLPSESGARQVTIRRLAANRLYKHRRIYTDLRLIREYEGRELWRVAARVSAGDSRQYGAILEDLQRTVQQTIEESGSVQPDFKICGAVPLIYMAQEQLLNDLINSFAAAFILIAVVMAVLVRSVLGGLLSMIPNLFPALVVFGWMGIRGTQIDIGTMMTASVALGIAVDDTLHFLVWFRRGFEKSNDRMKAIEFAFQHCATAMLQTTIICGLGTIPLMFSAFRPVARFATVLSALLIAALVGDLILLPAILASPFGRFVTGKSEKALVDANAPMKEILGT